MNAMSLLEYLNHPCFELTLTEGDFKTALFVDQERAKYTLTANEITLSYDKQRFLDDPTYYITEQLESHKQHLAQVEGRLPQNYQLTAKLLDRESDIEKIRQFIPEFAHRTVVTLTKAILNPFFWLRFTTLKKEVTSMVQKAKFRHAIKVVSHHVVKNGHDLLQEIRTQNSEQFPGYLQGSLDDLLNISRDLTFVYHRHEQSVLKQADVAQRVYHFFYSEESSIPQLT